MTGLKLGDRIRVVPETLGMEDGKQQPRTGTVIYIHPQGRFCVLEFEPQVRGGILSDPYQRRAPIRESFLLGRDGYPVND